ncbi:MAG TPA: hypothetical protein VGS12_11890 [Caulobacteraceae bacterium]|nr:hypothetical protein [Caulobacteraceae bacterium]
MVEPRRLTQAEWAALSPGLARALRRARVSPAIIARAHPAARLAGLWRGRTPILARPNSIWWPRAPADLAGDGRAMAVLQHELQHVLDYAEGFLSAARYLASPRHWTYACALQPDLSWQALGAEQRAALAERFWLAEHGLSQEDPEAFRALIPWARACAS